MKYQIRNIFIRVPTYCYQIAWDPSLALSPGPLGAIYGPTPLNSDDYATDPANEIAKYRVKELLQIGPYSGLTRPRNVAYCKGPSAFRITGIDQWDYDWTIFSNPSAVSTINVTKAPYSSTIDLKTWYPDHAATIDGYKAILSATFSANADPYVAWEYSVDTIKLLNPHGGLVSFEGYSPLLFSNSQYVSDPGTLTDVVIFYLKDINGYTSPWNYNTNYSQNSQVQDTRRSSGIFYRIERDGFAVEYKMCDSPILIQYLDNVIYDGSISNTLPTESFKQFVSLVDDLCAKYAATSGAYFIPERSRVSIQDSADAVISIGSGLLFNATVSAPSSTDSTGVATALTGGILEETLKVIDISDTGGVSVAINDGAIAVTIVDPDVQEEVLAASSNITSGENFEASVIYPAVNEEQGVLSGLTGGSLENV